MLPIFDPKSNLLPLLLLHSAKDDGTREDPDRMKILLRSAHFEFVASSGRG